MRLEELLIKTKYKCVQGKTDTDVSALIYDSRKIVPGCVFVCIRGAKLDSHSLAAEAAGKGAAAIVAEREVDVPGSTTVILVQDTRAALARMSAAWFGNPSEMIYTIGITGTKGKTTTSYMVRGILEQSGYNVGLIGTIETIIGDEHIPSTNTTPESYIIQETLAKMNDAGCNCVVMEVSSQALMMHRTDGILFDFAIFTNLEPDHIGPNEHKNLDDYIHCKSLLFKQCKVGICNADDKHLGRILEGHTCAVETFGFSENAMLRAENDRLYRSEGKLGVSYDIRGILKDHVEVDIPGKFSVYNSLAALAVCLHFGGVTGQAAKKALSDIHVRGRVELVPVSDRFTVLVDYAHNAMSLESLLETLKEYHPNRLVCLFGCGGNRSRERRFEMGKVSAKLADLTIVTSDNPRDEAPEAIIGDILAGIGDGSCSIAITDRAEAIRYAVTHALDGDIIVAAGKGHEDYQEVRGVKHHMDDREMIMRAASLI